jgi:hypothetical protein
MQATSLNELPDVDDQNSTLVLNRINMVISESGQLHALRLSETGKFGNAVRSAGWLRIYALLDKKMLLIELSVMQRRHSPFARSLQICLRQA